MPYYRGDYYRGDYYRGDPGIFSSIGRAIGSVGKVVGGVIGGPIGSVISGASNLLSGGAGSTPTVPTAMRPNLSISPGSANLPTITQGVGVTNVTPQGITTGISPLGTIGATLGAHQRGKHPNKSTYYTRGGVVPKGSRMVTNRTLNPANGRALRRALRRAHSFARLARHVMSFEVTGKKHGRGHFKTHRRAR